MPFAGYIRYPTIFGDQIVFTAEDDLWRVAASGGRAERLTAGGSTATHARFAPDGQQIAFVAATEGPDEVYVMPATGGPAERLTYQGGRAQVAGWRPDGSMILYATSAQQPSARWRVLYAVAPTGGEAVPLPYGIANAIAFGPNGAVVLGRNIGEPAHWKRYRGGTAGQLWIDPTGSGEFHPFLNLQGNLAAPAWVGDRFHFISDHEGMGDVWSCTATGEDLRRHTQQRDFYARGLTTDGKRLVFHAGGDLFLLDPTQNTVTKVEVDLPGSQAQRARKFVSAGQFLDSATLSPDGKSVALATRGKAFSMRTFEGAVIQHGAPDGVRYRFTDWLADGKRVVAVRDDGTEPRLAVFSADGSTPEQILDLDIGHVRELHAAPKGDLVLIANHRNEIMLVDVAAGTAKVLDRSPHGRSEGGPVMSGTAWSPDAAWVAYAFAINPQQTAIKLCRIETGETYQIIDPVRRDSRPAFDPAGRYLYFISARTFDPVQDMQHFDFSFPRGTKPYVITLRADLPSPFVPTPKAEDKKDDADANGNGNGEKAEAAPDDAAKEETPKPLQIDLEGIRERIVAFPVSKGRYIGVQGTRDGVLFAQVPVTGTRNEDWLSTVPPANASVDYYAFETYKQERVLDGISNFAVTADGKTLLYRAGDRLRVMKAGEKPPQSEKPGRESGWLVLDRVKVAVRPETE